MSAIASFHGAGSSVPPLPPWRMSGRKSRSGLAFASQTCMPLGPRRPRFVRASIRPRTPTILPSRTPMSGPQPFDQSTHADCTQCSGTAVVRSSARAGHCPLPECGVRSPHTSPALCLKRHAPAARPTLARPHGCKKTYTRRVFRQAASPTTLSDGFSR